MSKSRAVVLTWLALLALAGGLALTTPVSTDLTLFIPAHDARSALLLEQLRSGPATRLILIGLEGVRNGSGRPAAKSWPNVFAPTGTSCKSPTVRKPWTPLRSDAWMIIAIC